MQAACRQGPFPSWHSSSLTYIIAQVNVELFYEAGFTALLSPRSNVSIHSGEEISKLGGISIQHPSEPSISTRNPQPISAAKDRIGTPVAYTEGIYLQGRRMC